MSAATCGDYNCPICYPVVSSYDYTSSIKLNSLDTIFGSVTGRISAPKKEEEDMTNKNLRGRYGDLQFDRQWTYEPFIVRDLTNGNKVAEVHLIGENSLLEGKGNRYSILSSGNMTYPWHKWDALVKELNARRTDF